MLFRHVERVEPNYCHRPPVFISSVIRNRKVKESCKIHFTCVSQLLYYVFHVLYCACLVIR